MSGFNPTIYLIRHGEKPGKDASGKDLPGLSAQGQQRAKDLVNVFSKANGYNIGLIIAQHPDSDGDKDRPWLTVEPLVEALGCQYSKKVHRGDAQGVKDRIDQFDGPGDILVCWEHHALTQVAIAIGVTPKDGEPLYPQYPDSRFDIIWTLEPPYNVISACTSEQCMPFDNQYTGQTIPIPS